MPAPRQRYRHHAVYCYTSDLKKAAQHLAGFLNCTCLNVTLGNGVIKGSAGSVPQLGNAAWLVGHGLKCDTLIGSRARKTNVELEVLLDILVGDGYTAAIDTCCQPDKRRKVGAQYPLDYYCTSDGCDVAQIWQYKDLDTWWDDSRLLLRSS